MIDAVNAPTFGYEVRPDLPKAVVQAMLSNFRTRNPGVMWMTPGAGNRAGYNFDRERAEEIKAFLLSEEERLMGEVSQKRMACINAAKKGYKERFDPNLPLVEIVILGERVRLNTPDAVSRFIMGLVQINETVNDQVKVERRRALKAMESFKALQSQMLAAGVKPRVRYSNGKISFKHVGVDLAA